MSSSRSRRARSGRRPDEGRSAARPGSSTPVRRRRGRALRVRGLLEHRAQVGGGAGADPVEAPVESAAGGLAAEIVQPGGKRPLDVALGGGGGPRADAVDRLVDRRRERAVRREALAVLADARGLADGPRQVRRRVAHRVPGPPRADDLDQPHQRRGVEAVRPDQPARPRRARSPRSRPGRTRPFPRRGGWRRGGWRRGAAGRRRGRPARPAAPPAPRGGR